MDPKHLSPDRVAQKIAFKVSSLVKRTLEHNQSLLPQALIDSKQKNGLVAIYLPQHMEISLEQAKNLVVGRATEGLFEFVLDLLDKSGRKVGSLSITVIP